MQRNELIQHEDAQEWFSAASGDTLDINKMKRLIFKYLERGSLENLLNAKNDDGDTVFIAAVRSGKFDDVFNLFRSYALMPPEYIPVQVARKNTFLYLLAHFNENTGYSDACKNIITAIDGIEFMPISEADVKPTVVQTLERLHAEGRKQASLALAFIALTKAKISYDSSGFELYCDSKNFPTLEEFDVWYENMLKAIKYLIQVNSEEYILGRKFDELSQIIRGVSAIYLSNSDAHVAVRGKCKQLQEILRTGNISVAQDFLTSSPIVRKPAPEVLVAKHPLVDRVAGQLQDEINRLSGKYGIKVGMKLNNTQTVAQKRIEAIQDTIAYLTQGKELPDLTPKKFDQTTSALENCLLSLRKKMVSTGQVFQFLTRGGSFWVTGQGEIDKILKDVTKAKPTDKKTKKTKAKRNHSS